MSAVLDEPSKIIRKDPLKMKKWHGAMTALKRLVILHVFWNSTLFVSTLPVSDWHSNDLIDYCPFDWFKAYELIWHPPAPTGEMNIIQLPNDALPGVELSLTINGEEEKYPFYVTEGGYGGRIVNCSMPEPNFDNNLAMTRLNPICRLTEPPLMQCMVFDAWLDSAPGGPLFDLIHSGADTPQVNGAGDRPSEMPVGDEALLAVPVLYDQFVQAESKVVEAQWFVDLAKEETKRSEGLAKKVVAEAKAAVKFWTEDWAPQGKGIAAMKCFLGSKSLVLYMMSFVGNLPNLLIPKRLEAYLNSTLQSEEKLKKDNKEIEANLNDALNRWKFRRNKLTKFEDGRFPGGFVEDMKLDLRDVWGRTVLHWAAAQGQELLLAGGTDDSSWSRSGPKAASVEGWGLLVRELLARGASPNICDVDGRTPLDLAVSSNNAEAVKLLLDAGAGVDSKNRWGHSVQQMVKVVNGNDEIRDMLGVPRSKRSKRKAKRNSTNDPVIPQDEMALLSQLAEIAAGK